ncbi:chemotaxis protein histidine kinase CheA [Bradyrhizobium sp. AZCC 1678]|uniref:hypothetical protein n=1 Tax=Bradyrhizobium sp. AZCC 1678 TaxID=3117030 RepID=UPI002FEFBF3C
MQSTPTLKDTDPHDVFAIESLLHAHAEKAPPPAHDPAAPSVAPQVQVAAKPQAHVAPPISVSAPIPQVEPTFPAPDVRDIRVENVRPGEIKVDGLKPPGEQPIGKWAKRLIMALLGLCGAIAAAAWQHYGDHAKAMAAEWAPPFVLAALSSDKAAVAEQPNASAVQAAAADPAAAQPAATTPAQPEPAAAPVATASAESAQLQSMAQDLATMGQQVEELKTTIAQLKASQAQMARELAKAEAKASDTKASDTKASEAKAAETRPAEQNLRPRVSALTPRPAAPPPVRKPKPAYSYSPAPIAAPAAPLPPAQAAAPLPPAPPVQTIADDGEPVVRPPMPLR